MTDPVSNPESSYERANTFPWPPVLLVVAFGAPWLVGMALPFSWPGVDDVAARIIGSGFGIVGLALIVWAIVELRRAGTTIMPDTSSSTLVTSGPYAYFRNPIYLGETLILLWAAELSKNIWYVVAAVLFAVLVTSLQIVSEERHLEARFGPAYRDYKSRARRWI